MPQTIHRNWRFTVTVTQTPVESMRRIDVRVATADTPVDENGDGPALATLTGFYGAAVAPPGSIRTVWERSPESGGLKDRGRAGQRDVRGNDTQSNQGPSGSQQNSGDAPVPAGEP